MGNSNSSGSVDKEKSEDEEEMTMEHVAEQIATFKQQIEQLQEKIDNFEAKLNQNGLFQAKEQLKTTKVGNAVNKAKSKLRALMQRKMDSTEKEENDPIGTIRAKFDETKRKSENELVEMEICIPQNKWGQWDSSLEVSGLSANRTKNDGYGTVRAEHPFLWPMQNAKKFFFAKWRIAYFEMKIVGNPRERISLSDPGCLSIGLCDSNCPLSGCLVDCKNSFWIIVDGHIFIDGKLVCQDSEFGRGDVVGCGVDMATAYGDFYGSVFFTVNGVLTGPPIELPATIHGTRLFPAVCMGFDGEKIEAIFDQNAFKYDLRRHLLEQ